MTNELDRHETFGDGSSLTITHTEEWTFRDGEGYQHDDIWPTKAEAERAVEQIRAKVEAGKTGDPEGYAEGDYPAELVIVGRTVIAATTTSCWRERS